MRQKTLKLSEPVEFAGQQYTQLTFRKLKVKHMLEVNWEDSKSPMEQYAALAAASCAVDLGVIHELDMDDWNRVQEILESFFQKGETVSTQSPAAS
jgi:Phage tail assembly chaperone proteins, E, or 41 or 14